MPAAVIAASQDAFGTVLVVVVVVATVIAVITFLGAPALYNQIGRGGMSINEDGGDATMGRGAGAGAAVDARERDAEIRQMLHARNARRERRGEAPVDVEAELQRLTAPSIDAGLREEIRQLVVARNARRVRRGEAPLDVEQEIERQVRELG